MKHLLVSVALLCLAATPAHAQTPNQVSHQGFLTDNLGNPLTGQYDITFTFYEAGTNTVAFIDALDDVQVTDGIYDVDIGVFGRPFDQEYDLGISVAPDGEISRRPLTSAPYALSLRHLRVIPETATDGPNMIGGFSGNMITNSIGATIGGGGNPDRNGSPSPQHIDNADYATIGGGSGNSVDGVGGTVGGGLGNLAGQYAAVVAGGRRNDAIAQYSTVGGGFTNLAHGVKSTVSGGGLREDGDPNSGNEAQEDFATVGGGTNNKAGNGNDDRLDAMYATIGGGDSNVASGAGSTVGGGVSNEASGVNATVAGGSANIAEGHSASIIGGQGNQAVGSHSFAGGRMAIAAHHGSFVWQDDSPTGTIATDSLTSTGNNEFRARASGGFYLHSGAPLTTSGVELQTGESSWATLSSVHSKTDFEPIDTANLLEGLAGMEILRWRYKDGTMPHIGPMAQDFYAAFGVGPDEEHISTVDADGVALGAIQGLYQLVQELQAEVETLQREIAALK